MSLTLSIVLFAVLGLAVVVLGVLAGTQSARLRRLERELAAARSETASVGARVTRLSTAVEASGIGQRRRVAAVVNPTKNNVPRLLEELERLVERTEDLDLKVYETTEEDPGHQMARDALEHGADTVLAIGGDGTVRAVGEILAGTKATLGIVPLGTGNLLARNLDLPINDVEECLRIALYGRTRRIDTVDSRMHLADGSERRDVFLVIGGAGLDADVMGDTRDDLKAKAGWLAYGEAGIRHLPGGRTGISVRIDGGPARHHKVRSVMVANCGTLTGGMELIPTARVDDGLLDLVLLTPKHALDWVRIALKTVLRHRYSIPVMETYQGSRVRIRMDEPMPAQFDGDAVGDVVGLDARIQADSLAVMVPRG